MSVSKKRFNPNEEPFDLERAFSVIDAVRISPLLEHERRVRLLLPRIRVRQAAGASLRDIVKELGEKNVIHTSEKYLKDLLGENTANLPTGPSQLLPELDQSQAGVGSPQATVGPQQQNADTPAGGDSADDGPPWDDMDEGSTT